MELSDLPGELVERGVWWQIGGFAIVSAAGVALLVEFEGSETHAYRYLEAAVKTMYWANVFVLIGLFEGLEECSKKRQPCEPDTASKQKGKQNEA